MHSFVPDLSPKEIVQYFNEIDIEIRQCDILKPSNSFLLRLYENILSYFCNSDFDFSIDDSLFQMLIYKKIYSFLTKIGIQDFNIKDLSCDSKRLINILSYIINYSMYRDTKKVIYEKMQSLNEERNILNEDIEKKIKNKEKELKSIKNNLNTQNKNISTLEAEICDLENELKEVVKIQRVHADETEQLKYERDELNDKLNSYQLLIMNTKQDIECLKTQIVSDPAKLVSLLKEMKELLNKENETLKNLEKEKINHKNQIETLTRLKQDIKHFIEKSVVIKNIKLKIEDLTSFISNTDVSIQNTESTINASKIRLNYIIRQISHIESKIYNLQETDKKCTEDMCSKLDKLKCDYRDISVRRSDTQELIDKNIKKIKVLEYEIIKAKNEHECYISDIINLLNNIKDNQTYYFNSVRRHL